MTKKVPKLLPCKNLKRKNEEVNADYLLGIKAYLMINRKNPGIRLNDYGVYRSDIKSIVKNETCTKFARSHADDSMKTVSDKLGVNLAFWYRPDQCSQGKVNQFVIPKLIHSVSDPQNDFGTANFLLDRNRVDPETGEHDFQNCSLILDEKICGDTDQIMNIFEAISSSKSLNCSELIRKWGKNSIRLNEEKKFSREFGFGFEIWCKTIRSNIVDNDRKRKRLIAIDKCIMKSANPKKKIYLQFHGVWPEDKFTIDFNDKFRVVEASAFPHFDCPSTNCAYRTSERSKFDRHTQSCQSATNHIYHQQNLTDGGALEFLLENKFLSKKPTNYNSAFFDIETTSLTKDEAVSNQTIVLSTAKLATISVTKNFGDKTTQVFVRQDSSEESYLQLVNQFITYLLELKYEHQSLIDKEINDAYFELTNRLFDKNIFQTLTPDLKANYFNARRYLGQIRELKIFGFNSEHFG